MITARENSKPAGNEKERCTRAGAEQAIMRAQIYAFLASVYLYPLDNWSEEMPLVQAIAAGLEFAPVFPALEPLPLAALQSAYRRAFGAAGSLCYETEYGLPHEYRQAQELADINGFYGAFGFSLGGSARERPDHVAAELEFMYILALKEAHAHTTGAQEELALCVDAQAKFLAEHLGGWIELFAQSLALNTQDEPYLSLGNSTAAFVHADAGRLGVAVTQRHREKVQHTPFDPDFSCAACPAVNLTR
jgi:putative dimethyl sulfoxide reductase chaperone